MTGKIIKIPLAHINVELKHLNACRALALFPVERRKVAK
jgi:hypothetical protein